MKTNYLTYYPLGVLLIATLYLTGCVQPYSAKSFYKAQNTANTPSSADDAAGSLSYAAIVSVSKLSNPSEKEISKALRKLNSHWRVKGYDAATKAVFYFNFSSKNDEETFIWYPNEKTAEYVTTNSSHYTAIVNDLKTGGYKQAGNTATGDEQYVSGNKSVSVSKVVIFDNSAGYKFTF